MRGTNLRNLRDRAEDARNENILLKKRLATAKRKIEVLEAKARANTPPKKLRLGKFSANSRSSRKAVTQLKDIASQLSPSVKSPSQTTILRNEKKEGLSVMSANISKLKGKPFSIMYDTSTRVSKKWLPILANAWVENEVAEVMIDMQDVPDTKAENLSTLIGERLGALKLSPTKYVTSTTDNTNSLSGKLGGCAALLDKKFKSKSFRVPCSLHVVHLAHVHARTIQFPHSFALEYSRLFGHNSQDASERRCLIHALLIYPLRLLTAASGASD